MKMIAGLDEVGTGALAGPFISVIAVFREQDMVLLPPGVKDSKKTTEAHRGAIHLAITKVAFDVGMGHAFPWEIDKLGPGEALQLCYRRAYEELRCVPDVLVIDGTVGIRNWEGLTRPNSVLVTPKADAKYREVSAASIIAKWSRDEMMIAFSKKYPVYEFASNKGYGSASHEAAIKAHGLLIDDANHTRYVHRRTYTRKFTYEGVKHA